MGGEEGREKYSLEGKVKKEGRRTKRKRAIKKGGLRKKGEEVDGERERKGKESAFGRKKGGDKDGRRGLKGKALFRRKG